MKDFHKSAIAETGLIILFTVLPTIFIGFKFLFSSENLQPSILYKGGEFFLYSVSLLGTSFLIFNHFKVRKSDILSLFSFLCIVLIVIFSLAYTVIANTTNPRLNYVKWVSFLSFLISVPLFYYSQVVSNKNSPDVGQIRRDEQDIIQNALK